MGRKAPGPVIGCKMGDNHNEVRQSALLVPCAVFFAGRGGRSDNQNLTGHGLAALVLQGFFA